MPAATARLAAAPGTVTFLKHGVVLRRAGGGYSCRFFASNAVLGAALVLIKLLVVAPLVKVLNCGGAYSGVIRDDIHGAAARALLAGVAYLTLYLAA